MDNSGSNNSEKYYNTSYTSLDDKVIENIRKNYKVVDVDWLDVSQVNYVMLHDKYFEKSLKKKEVVNKMLDFYLNDKYKIIYKTTEYLCNEKEQICICNTHAEQLRNIYKRKDYIPNQKYISWCKKYDDNF